MMAHRKLLLGVFFTGFLAWGCTDLSPPSQPARAVPEALVWIQDTLQHFMAEGHIPGLAVAIGAGDTLLWQRAYGWADIALQQQADENTLWRIASISKSFTGIALGQLVEAGKLDLDARVRHVLPSFPQKKYPVTIRQLAGHLGGIRHYRGDEYYNQVTYPNIRAVLELFQEDPLAFEPGTAFLYSSHGYTLLSAVLEEAAGVPFTSYLKSNVLDTAGMDRTIPDRASPVPPHRAQFYQWTNGRLIEAPIVDNSHRWAAGGYLSTAGDLIRFGNSVLAHRLVAPETRQLLFTPLHTSDGQAYRYGLGWAVKDHRGVRYVGHTGGAVGGSSVLILSPRHHMVLTLLCNMQGVELHELATVLLDRLVQSSLVN